MNIDKFMDEHPKIAVALFMPLVFVALIIWCILAYVEQGYMWLKGYYWCPFRGGYHRRDEEKRAQEKFLENWL
jgi:hypothetical protein